MRSMGEGDRAAVEGAAAPRAPGKACTINHRRLNGTTNASKLEVKSPGRGLQGGGVGPVVSAADGARLLDAITADDEAAD
jgi:hypothetical protein